MNIYYFEHLIANILSYYKICISLLIHDKEVGIFYALVYGITWGIDVYNKNSRLLL